MNWLITGGCGFIGVNLIRKILSNPNSSVRVYDNLTVGSRDDLNAVCSFSEVLANEASWAEGAVELIKGDILDEKLIEAASKEADVIVHLAANTGVGPSVENPREDCSNNVMGILNVLEAARANDVNRFVFASSGAPVGECEPPIHEKKVPRPVSPYGASKLAGEGYCSAYYQTFKIDTVALRFGNVYGPYSLNKASVVAKFIKQARDGESLEIYGNGQQTRDFIYVEDLVEAILKAAELKGIGGEIFQIATNRESSLLELMEELKPVIEQMTGDEVNIIHGDARLGDVMRNFSDTTKAKDQLGWVAKTELKEGLFKTSQWFETQLAK